MTQQALEEIKYKGKYYALDTFPLEPFFKQNPVEFKPFTTAHWRGYQGEWLLKNNKLYLKSILSVNYNIHDIFQSHKKVLATWFSGQLSMGLGDLENDCMPMSYQNFLWMRIEKGIVKQRRIIQKPKDYSQKHLGFGKFKTMAIIDVLRDKSVEDNSLSMAYFIQKFKTLLSGEESNFFTRFPNFKIKDKDLDLFKDYELEYQNQYHILSLKPKSYKTKKIKNACSKISQILKENKENIFPLKQEKYLNYGVQYLEWAIEIVDYFQIDPGFLEKEKSIRKIKNFKIKKLDQDKIFFKLNYTKEIYTFSQKLKTINKQKYEEYYDVKYHKDYHNFSPRLSKEQMKRKFQYYLED